MVSYTPEWRVCAFCKKDDRVSDLVHYSTRRYAHAVCLYRTKGEAAIAGLHAHQIRRLPVILLKQAGLQLNRLDDIYAAAEKRELVRQ